MQAEDMFVELDYLPSLTRDDGTVVFRSPLPLQTKTFEFKLEHAEVSGSSLKGVPKQSQ